MGRLYISSLKRNIRSKEEIFWSILFPLIMATFFYVTFGSGIDVEQMQKIPVALVSENNTAFETFLDALDGDMLVLTPMESAQAEEALKNGVVKGIFYSRKEPELTVSASNMNESILEALLEGYLENEQMLTDIGKNNPLKLPAAIAAMTDYREMTQSVNMLGETTDDNIAYFFALVGMTCLFGGFLGMVAAIDMRADQSPLAARRSAAPADRLQMLLAETLACFTVQFFCVCILLLYMYALGISFGKKWILLLPVCVLGSLTGVAYGMFLGGRRMAEGFKIAILVVSSLLMSFLAGLMMGNMKDIVEHHCPVINRINPAALIADAFYSVSVYDNPARYRTNLLLLAAITVLLLAAAWLTLRRERYESI